MKRETAALLLAADRLRSAAIPYPIVLFLPLPYTPHDLVTEVFGMRVYYVDDIDRPYIGLDYGAVDNEAD